MGIVPRAAGKGPKCAHIVISTFKRNRHHPGKIAPMDSGIGRLNFSRTTQPSDEEPLFGGTPFRDAHTDDAEAHDDTNRNYYTLLNIDKDATEEQIRDAYKTMADPKHKEMAEESFRDIQKAYEVLSDSERRAVYDHFGEAGLQSSWSLTVPGQSPAELRAEMERQARLRQAADAESMVKSRGEFSAAINATPLFAPTQQLSSPLRPRLAPPTFSERLDMVNCAQLVGKHSFEMPTSSTSAVSIAGQMMSRGGMGGGNLIGTVKNQWSPHFVSEISATLLKPHVLTAKGQYTVDENLFFTYAIVSQTLATPPSVTMTWGQRLSSKSSLTGFSSYKTGAYTLGPWGADRDGNSVMEDTGALIVGVTKQEPNAPGWTFQATMSEVDLSFGYDWNMRIMGGVLIRSGFVLGTGNGFSVFTNGERRVTENIRMMMGVDCGLLTGVQFKVRVSRLGQRIVLPIILAPNFRSDLAVAATLVPAAIFALSHYFYFAPRKQRLVADRVAKLRQDNLGAIEQRRTSAEQTRILLQGQALKKADAEFGRQGVVIIQAYYGDKSRFPKPMEVSLDVCSNKEDLLTIAGREPETAPDTLSEDQPYWWDVRVPLQMLVNQSQLVIPAGRSKSKLVGFFDPCIGEKKWLYVRYVFRQHLHETMVDDLGAMAMPLRTQQL